LFDQREDRSQGTSDIASRASIQDSYNTTDTYPNDEHEHASVNDQPTI